LSFFNGAKLFFKRKSQSEWVLRNKKNRENGVGPTVAKQSLRRVETKQERKA
jgi:hypothetical protein